MVYYIDKWRFMQPNTWIAWRKAINAKSGKKRLILAQLHRSCVSLRAAHPMTHPSPRRGRTQAPASEPHCSSLA